jgi:hypothetical protein
VETDSSGKIKTTEIIEYSKILHVTVLLKIPAFWNILPYRLVYRYQHFGEACSCHLKSADMASYFRRMESSTAVRNLNSVSNLVIDRGHPPSII